MLYETFAAGNARYGRPSNPAFLLEAGELFAWAARNGMFRDIEAPKFQMLENERRLDASQNIGNGAPAV